MEGEPIRDVLPDPKGRYVYLLGRHVHVFDANGERELHTLNVDDPAAIAASVSLLAVAHGTEIVSFDAVTFAEKGRTPATTGPVGALVMASGGLPLALTSEGSPYGINAYATARDEKASTLVTTERTGYVTIYRIARPAVPK